MLSYSLQIFAMHAASGMPTLRKKILEHVMVWLTRCKTSLDEPTFKHVKVNIGKISKYSFVV